MKSKVISKENSMVEKDKTFKRLPIYILIVAIIIAGVLAFDSWEYHGEKDFHEVIGTISVQQQI